MMKKAKWIKRNLGEDREYRGPEKAKWVWAWEYCRIQAKKEFVIGGVPEYAEAYFVCDNPFDLYLNGKRAVLENGAAEVTELLCEGENIIAVRAYQTNSAERFLSAFRGGITGRTENGKSFEAVTDASWKQLRLCTFHEKSETDGWQTECVGERAREERFEHLKEFDLHPSVTRRATVFAKSFTADEMPVSAVMRGSANGLWQPYVNGKTVRYRLMPGTMEGRKEYQEFSVLPFLKKGENEIRVVLGNGWYNCECFGILDAKQPCFVGELELEYKDGAREIIATDENWTSARSRIYEDDLQYGERCDARIDEENTGEFAVCADVRVELVKQDYPLMGVIKTIPPVSAERTGGKIVFDFGYNFSGRAKFTFRNTYPGQKFIIRYYEFINNEGNFNLHTYGDVFYPCDTDVGGKAEYAVKNIDFYIAKGAECEGYEPIFAYTGLRFAVVEGVKDDADCGAEGVEIGALLEENGKLSSQCGFIEKLWDMTVKTWRGNAFSGPTDCPSREKNYWNGDMQLFAHAACWCTDNSKFLARWTEFGRKIEYGVYGWEDEEYILPWVLYKFYGDREILERKYDVVLRLMRERGVFDGNELAKNPHSPYNDHLTCGVNIDKQLFSDCYYCRMIDTAAKIAAVIGEDGDRADFEEKYAKSLAKFRERYTENLLLTENPAGIVLALAFGLFEGEYARFLANRLNDAVRQNGYKLLTGFHATRYILDVLCDYGYTDTAWRLVSQEEYPSWRFIADGKSATFTETWRGTDVGETEMSMNHFTPGAFAEWFFEYLGGIRIDKCRVDLRQIRLEPIMFAEVGSFAAEAELCGGTVKSAWRTADGGFEYCFTVPKGVTAIVKTGTEESVYLEGTYTINVKV